MFANGEEVYYDRSLRVTFVRYVDPGQAIVRVGADTRLVDALTLSSQEA